MSAPEPYEHRECCGLLVLSLTLTLFTTSTKHHGSCWCGWSDFSLLFTRICHQGTNPCEQKWEIWPSTSTGTMVFCWSCKQSERERQNKQPTAFSVLIRFWSTHQNLFSPRNGREISSSLYGTTRLGQLYQFWAHITKLWGIGKFEDENCVFFCLNKSLPQFSFEKDSYGSPPSTLRLTRICIKWEEMEKLGFVEL